MSESPGRVGRVVLAVLLVLVAYGFWSGELWLAAVGAGGMILARLTIMKSVKDDAGDD